MIPYIISSFRGGISDEKTRGTVGSFAFGYDLDIHKRRDSLSCGFKMLTITDSRYSTAAGLIKYAVAGADGSSYCFTDKGEILSISGMVADPVQNYLYNDSNGEIKGAAEWQFSSGQDYLFWATNSSVSYKLFPGAEYNIWTDVTQGWRNTLTPASWHPMKQACGNLMIGNESFVSYITYAGDFTLAGMNLRFGNIIKCLEERDDYLIIGTQRKDNAEEGHIWNWITTALNWVQKKKIPVKGVNALIDTEKLMLQGGVDGELFYSDFVNTAPLNSVPYGGSCNPGGVAIEDDLAIFGIYGGTSYPGLYSYGRRMLNRPSAFNLEHRLAADVAGSTISEIGAVWSNNGQTYASWKTAEANGDFAYGVDMLSTTTRATARYEGLEFSGAIPHLSKQMDTVKLTMLPLPASTSVNLLYKPGRQTTGGSSSALAGWKYAKVADASGTTYSVTDSTEVEFIVNEKNKVFELGLEITPSGSTTPEVTSVVGYLAGEQLEH